MKHLFYTYLFVILMSMAWVGAYAYDIAAKNSDGVTIYYNYTNGSTGSSVYVTYPGSINYGGGYSGDVVIPETVTYNSKTYSVTSINNNVFRDCCWLTSVTIPESMTSIGEHAFDGCTSLTSVTIPSSVTSIGGAAFENCSGLSSIIVNEDNTKYDSRGNCNAIIDTKTNTLVIGCKNTIIPESVTSIGGAAFSGCSGLTSITIPESVTSIGDWAFHGCSGLASVAIPDGVTTIGEKTFYGCSGLTSVTIPSSVTSIGDYAFEGCSGLTSVTIGNSVTSIGTYAFYGCSGLTSVTIPESVTSIGSFYGCSGLTSVTWNAVNYPNFTSSSENPFYYLKSQITEFNIGNNVTKVPAYLCFGMSSLTSVTIPESVTSIGSSAFSGCTGLSSIVVNKDNTKYDSRDNCNAIIDTKTNSLIIGCKNTIIPGSVTSIGKGAFHDCSGLTSVTIPNSVTSIGSSAFSGCSGLTSVTIPSSVKYINSSAFEGCSGLASVAIPDGVTTIGEKTFYGCSGLTSVIIPNSVKGIRGSAFYGCSGLTSVIIPNSVTSIGSDTFSGCSGLTSVTWNAVNYPDISYFSAAPFYNIREQIKEFKIGSEVTKIPAYLCYGMRNMTSVTIPESVTSIGDYAFSYCSGLKSVTIPESVTSIGDHAFYQCSGLTSVTIPSSVTSIDAWAFYGCSGLTSVTIPSSVTSIGTYAFYGCSGLTSVTIPSSVTSIGTYAFYACSGLTSVAVMQKTPPDFHPFTNETNITLYVPYGGKPKYETADYWKNFKKIEEMETLVASIALNKTTLSIIEGDNETLSVTYTPADADVRSVTWTTSNANVATVDAQGKVTAVAEGVVIVTATTTNGKTAQCVVNVKKDTVNISFADLNVKTACVENWDTDGNGKLSYDEAAAVSSIGEVFRDKKNITSFEELQYFTGLTEISNNAFSGCAELTSIVIPDNVASIGRSAFSGCSGLTSVTIPESVASIDESAFSGCSGLESITIPNNVTSIGKSTFSGCSGLTSVTISESVASIDESAFSGCSGLKSITIPNNVTSIGKSTFSGCSGLTSVTIPESVASIGESAFSGCSGLAEIIIPDSVESIGDNAFSGCTGISSITIPCNVSSIGRSAFAGCSNIRSVKWNAKNSNSSNNPFSDAPYIYEFVVGKDVINIPNYLLYGMNNLRSLTIGAGVLTIGNQGGVTPAKVFWMPNTPPTGCNNVSGMVNYTSNDSFSQPDNSSSLQNIRICRYLSSIFEVDGVRYVLVSPSERTCNAIDCVYDSTLCEVNIDKTVGYKGINLQVKDINPYTFYSNTYIKKAYIDTDGELGAHAFENCNNMTFCTMGDRITKIDDYAFSGCKVLHRAGVDLYQEDADYNGIIVSKAVSHIGDYAFYGCSNIKNVIMEDRKDNDMQLTLGSNGSSPLFSSCPLDSVYIGRNITYSTTSSAGYSPFYRNTSLRTVHITDKETEISDNEFYGCTNLKNVRIGDGVTYIGNWAFSGCSSIEYFSFGSAMQSIGKEAFSDCTAMTKLISHAMTPPVCDSQALDDISKWVCTLSVPKGTVSSYQQAAQWKEFFFIDEGATGIQRTVSNDSKSFKTYNINGYEQNGQQRGLNIIRMSDGTVKKVMVK